MNDHSKKTWTITAVALIVAAIAVFAIVKFVQNRNSASLDGQPADGTTLTDLVPPDSQATTTSSTPATGSGAAGLSASARYQEAMAKYPYRIQFSTNCHGIVGSAGNGTLVVKKGSQIMLDNQDDVTRTIAYKGHSYTIKAHDFVIGTATVTGTYPVTCNNAGAAQLRVEP